MRQDRKIMFWVNLGFICLMIYKTADLIFMIYDKPVFNGAITRSEYDSGFPGYPRFDAAGNAIKIPKIIHQTYKTETVPEIWQEVHQSIRENHPDYEYILWTDQKSREFIANNFDWFLPTFDSYEYPIMRADAIRYFVLYQYGGIYIDMDIGTKLPLHNLLNLAAFFPKTDPTGVSNDIMACVPGHPLFKDMIFSLESQHQNLLLPYLTIMYSAGPVFVSMVLHRYLRSHPSLDDPYRVHIMMPDRDRYTNFLRIRDLFTMLEGATWHQGDAKYLLLIQDHAIAFAAICVVVVPVLLLAVGFVELRLIKFSLFLLRFATRCFNIVLLKTFPGLSGFIRASKQNQSSVEKQDVIVELV